jgi:DNA helicase-4
MNLIEQDFLHLSQQFYSSYLERLEATGLTDFDGLMQKAAAKVWDGSTEFLRRSRNGELRRIRFLFIDEYQDFSLLFHHLLEAIRAQNPTIRVFCVGDDWQAINGFAGSDLKFYRDFESTFQPACVLKLATNYRSGAKIVASGNAIMLGLEPPGRARAGADSGLVEVSDLATFRPTPPEESRHSADISSAAVVRLVAGAISRKMDVVLLSRTNWIPWPVEYLDNKGSPIDQKTLNAWRRVPDGEDEHGPELYAFLALVRSRLPEDFKRHVTISTVHSYKGKQQQAVIILDAFQRRYPLVHPDWIFTRILGTSLDSVVAEERRLFYVATTRAKNHLIYFTRDGEKSEFLQNISQLRKVEWREYPVPAVAPELARVTVRIGNQKTKGSSPTQAIRELLKAERLSGAA